MTAKKASGIASYLERQRPAAPTAPAAPATPTDSAPTKRRRQLADGRVQHTAWVQPAGIAEMKKLAADLSVDAGRAVDVSELSAKAWNLLLQQHGRPPVA